MRKIRKNIFEKLNFISLLFLPLLLFTSCENIQFNQSLRKQLDEEFSVTYSFYEYPDLDSPHQEMNLYTGRSVSSSSFPVFTHTDEFLVGWQYFFSDIENARLPSNFSLNDKGFISSFRAGLKAEKLYAVWKAKRTVRFETGLDLVIDSVVVAEGDTVSAPEIQQKYGRYRFKGWYADEEFTQVWDFSTPILEDTTLYAKWLEVNNITYYKNDGSQDSSYSEFDIDINYSISDCMFGERSGYGFLGWSDSPEGSIKYYAGDVIESLHEDLILYAVWSTDIIIITYIDKSQTYTQKTARYGRGAHIRVGNTLNENESWYQNLYYTWKINGKEIKGYSTNPDAEIDNLEFDRWGSHMVTALDEEGNTYNTWSNYLPVDDNMTFYAFWGDKTYYVYFRYYNLDNEMQYFDYQEVAWNTKAQRPDSVPALRGYSFVDWYRRKWNGRLQEYEFEDTPFDFDTVFNEDNIGDFGIELFAKFEEADTGQAAVSVGFEENPESDISVMYEGTGNDRVFTAPAGYLSYKWYLDGVELTSLANQNEVTIDAGSLTVGWHDVSLIVYDGTNYYSWSGQFYK